jgi:hydrogenase nickel incorporation protein HypA/HybF
MHEMSLMESIVGLVEDERRREAFGRVRTVRLRVGALAGVEPDALRFCFAAISAGRITEGARLEIDAAPGQGWCGACRRRVPLAERFDACPDCGDGPLPVTGGGDLRLVDLEVE